MIARFNRFSPAMGFAGLPGSWRRRWHRFCARLRAPDPAEEARLFRDRAERFVQYCAACREETSHEGVGEVGLGWFAQICRCRRCGRHSAKIWTCW
jgi:predicted YcjX-like family ATPase